MQLKLQEEFKKSHSTVTKIKCSKCHPNYMIFVWIAIIHLIFVC